VNAVVFTAPRALAQIIEADGWWRENRQAAPTLFETEVASAYALLARVPEAGQRFTTRRRRGVRRLLLRRCKFHIYYVHLRHRNEVLVVAVWSAVRGQGPRLDLP